MIWQERSAGKGHLNTGSYLPQRRSGEFYQDAKIGAPRFEWKRPGWLLGNGKKEGIQGARGFLEIDWMGAKEAIGKRACLSGRVILIRMAAKGWRRSLLSVLMNGAVRETLWKRKTGWRIPLFNTSHNICNAKYRTSEQSPLNTVFKQDTSQTIPRPCLMQESCTRTFTPWDENGDEWRSAAAVPDACRSAWWKYPRGPASPE